MLWIFVLVGWVVDVVGVRWLTTMSGGGCWVSQWSSPSASKYWRWRLFWWQHKSHELVI